MTGSPAATFYGTVGPGQHVVALIHGTPCGEPAVANADGFWQLQVSDGGPCSPADGDEVQFSVDGGAATGKETWTPAGAPRNVADGVDLRSGENAPADAAVVSLAADSTPTGIQTQSRELRQAHRLVERANEDLKPFIDLLEMRLDAGDLDDDADLRHELRLLRDVVAPTLADAQTILQRTADDGQLSEGDRGQLRADIGHIERLKAVLTHPISLAVISAVPQLVLRALGG